MINQNQSDQPLWTVGVPRQTQIPDIGRGYVAGWEIPVVMADKSSFTVTVSQADFTPEHVMKVIQEHVANFVMVQSLRGEPLPPA